MSASIDTCIFISALSGNQDENVGTQKDQAAARRKNSVAPLAAAPINKRATVSVQVLNELANVARKARDKGGLGLSIATIEQVIIHIASTHDIVPMTTEVTFKALEIARQTNYSIYDSTMVAAALLNGCTVLHTEDMQKDRVIEDRLTITHSY